MHTSESRMPVPTFKEADDLDNFESDDDSDSDSDRDEARKYTFICRNASERSGHLSRFTPRALSYVQAEKETRDYGMGNDFILYDASDPSDEFHERVLEWHRAPRDRNEVMSVIYSNVDWLSFGEPLSVQGMLIRIDRMKHRKELLPKYDCCRKCQISIPKEIARTVSWVQTEALSFCLPCFKKGKRGRDAFHIGSKTCEGKELCRHWKAWDVTMEVIFGGETPENPCHTTMCPNYMNLAVTGDSQCQKQCPGNEDVWFHERHYEDNCEVED